jgi:hypothetical protein
LSLRWILILATITLACGENGSYPVIQSAPGQARPLAAKVSADCTLPVARLPAGATRVYIALRNGTDGSGKSAKNARDGSTTDAFDSILRCYAEGCRSPAIAKTENLIVCLGSGTFSTRGTYDALHDSPHPTQNGFTVGKGWKIHGRGPAQTTLQLAAFLPVTSATNPRSLPVGTGANVVISTTNHDASGVEVSDLTVDANYPALKQLATARGVTALNLEAIQLWSGKGGNWIHDVNVINTSGELGAQFETFPVWIVSALPNSKPTDSAGNIIENVTMSRFGGGFCTAIAVANSLAEVRNNQVNGYQIGYGGWTMGAVRFHDNLAVDTAYGFNIDSLTNDGVIIESNQITNPRSYGIVIGGGGTYTNLRIVGNTIHLSKPGSTGILFQGNVTHTTIARNEIAADSSAARAVALRSFSNGAASRRNGSNTYQSNRIDSGLRILFEGPSLRSLNCAFGNRGQHGNPRSDLPDTTKTPCIP